MARPTSVLTALLLCLLFAGCKQQASDDETTRQPNTTAATGEIEAGNITILGTLTDGTDRGRAKQNVEDTLTRHPDVACLVGLWSYNGPAILSAVKGARLEGKVNIVCFDEEDDTLQGVKDGYIHATVVQQPYEFGYQSVRILAALARGDESVLPENGVVNVPVRVIRKDNADDFWAQLRERRTDANLPPKTGTDVHIAFVTNNASDFWSIAKAGVRAAERDFGVQCDVRMPGQGGAQEQQRIVEELIAKGIDGFAISPNDAANQIDMLNRACEVTRVITHDSDAPESKRLCYVGTNNYLAGREAGKLIKELLPDGGKIMLFVGQLDAQNARERRQGIIDELNGDPIPESIQVE